jgi:hypothetical protein
MMIGPKACYTYSKDDLDAGIFAKEKMIAAQTNKKISEVIECDEAWIVLVCMKLSIYTNEVGLQTMQATQICYSA